MPLNTPLVVYTIHENERNGRKFWTRIGDATVARDGQIDIELRALPANGKLALRGIKAAEIQGTAPADAIAPGGTVRDTADAIREVMERVREALPDGTCQVEIRARILASLTDACADLDGIADNLPRARGT